MTLPEIIGYVLGLLSIIVGAGLAGSMVMVMDRNDSVVPFAFPAVLVAAGLAAVGWAAS